MKACASESPLSKLAQELARGRADDDGAVLDGCASACLSRRLAAEGRPPRVRLCLTDLGVTNETAPKADRAALAARLDEAVSHRPLTRPRPQVAPAASPGRVHTENDYLRALARLTNPLAECGARVAGTPTLAAHVAATLGVSRPTAGEMLARLERRGLVHRGATKELLLTPRGRIAASHAEQRLHVLERFAVTYLGYSDPEAAERAAALDAGFDDDAVGRLRTALGA